MSAIKDIIKSYISVDDELKAISKQATSLRTQKKILGEQISDYLEKNSDSPMSILQVGKDSFKIVTCKKKKMNKAHIESVLKDKLSEDTVVKIMEELTEESEEAYLKRSIKK